jgi:hypothetical protein
MAQTFTEGDIVQIADREPTAADTKSQLFYAHYRRVRGTVSKIYSDGTALVIAENGSLPEDVRSRHDSGTTAMRQKWLDGLSDEGRNRLSAAEKKFALRYSLLVSQADLRADGSAPDAGVSAPAAASDATGASDPASTAPARKSMEDLEADEARHLSELRQQKSRG